MPAADGRPADKPDYSLDTNAAASSPHAATLGPKCQSYRGYSPRRASCQTANPTDSPPARPTARQPSIRCVTVTNKFTNPDLGSLKLTKALASDSDPVASGVKFKFVVEFKSAIPDAKADPNFVTGTVNYVDKTWTVELGVGQSALLKDLPNGVEYKITEDLTGKTGYAAVNPVTGKIDISSDATRNVEVTVENNYTAPRGSLKVTKREAGDNTAASGKPSEYQFYVKCDGLYLNETTGKFVAKENATKFTVAADGTKVINGLILDKKYSVEEVAVTGLAHGYTCKATYSPETIELTDSNKDDAEIVITNTYKAPVPGKLKVEKKVAGDPDVGEQFPLCHAVSHSFATANSITEGRRMLSPKPGVIKEFTIAAAGQKSRFCNLARG